MARRGRLGGPGLPLCSSPGAIEAYTPRTVGTKTRRTATDLALPEVDAVMAALPADLVDSESDLRARVRLARLNIEVGADASELQAAIDLLRSRAAGELDASPFGDPIHAETFDELVDIGERALDGGRLDLATVLALQHEAGAIAARQGRRLILFLGVSSEIRRLGWDLSTAELARRGEPAERYTELGRLLLLWTEMSSLAMGEGYRATERELLARDVEARRAALDELLGAVSNDARAGARLRRLAMRYGLDPDAAFRVAAIHPGPEADPTPEEAGFDDEDLDSLARRIDQRIRRQGSRDGIGSGIRVPLAVSWRGAIVAILGSDPQEWRRLQEAVSAVLGASGGGRDARRRLPTRPGRPSRCAPTASGHSPGRWSSYRKASAWRTASVVTGSSTTSPSSASSGSC